MGSVATCIVSLLAKFLQFLLCLKLKIHVLITLSYDHVISMWKSRPNIAGNGEIFLVGTLHLITWFRRLVVQFLKFRGHYRFPIRVVKGNLPYVLFGFTITNSLKLITQHQSY